MPNGIADVAVKTGRSPRFMGLGVAVFGGSHRMGFCSTMAFGGGPSGWYGMKMSRLADCGGAGLTRFGSAGAASAAGCDGGGLVKLCVTGELMGSGTSAAT
jgi:hypothetical protein